MSIIKIINLALSTSVKSTTVSTKAPEINLHNLPSKALDILTYVCENPLKDHIYCFPFLPSVPPTDTKEVVAGSAAVIFVSKMVERIFTAKERQDLEVAFQMYQLTHSQTMAPLKEFYPLGYFPIQPSFEATWKNNDEDRFQLNCAKNSRCLDEVNKQDHVQVTTKSVVDLLMEFDLGCCRAAFDGQANIWVSAQCLFAMITGCYPVPQYTLEPEKFRQMLHLARPNADNIDFRLARCTARSEKYTQRGYQPVGFATTEHAHWLFRDFSTSAYYEKTEEVKK